MAGHYNNNFSPDARERGNDHVIIAFKRINSDGKEHWLNRLAVNLTKRSSDVYPCGQLAHVELMFENNGLWYRCSINKKTGTYDAKGNLTWKVGTVHYKHVNKESMADYDYFKYYVDRDKQQLMYKFCMTHLEDEFNFWGYVLNFFIPFGKIGTKRYHEKLDRQQQKRSKWFCSELVVVALQSAGEKPFKHLEARGISPNELYRIFSRLGNAYDGNTSVVSSPVSVINI